MKTLRILHLVLSLLVISLMTTCSSDNPTDSDDQDEALASATIGPAGGALTHDDFVLTVPAGAFASDATLRLYLSDETHPGQEQTVSEVYRIDGFPDWYSQPLHARVRYSDTLIDYSYLGVGGDIEDPISGELQPVFRMIFGADSGGFITAEIPAVESYGLSSKGAPASSSAADSPLSAYFAALTGFEPPDSTYFPDFTFVWPSKPQTLWEMCVENYRPIFEEAWDSLTGPLGLSDARIPKPIEVYFLNFSPAENKVYCMTYPSWGSFCLVLNEPMWVTAGFTEVSRGWIIRELTHLIGCTHDNTYFSVLLMKRAIINPQPYWFHHAVASFAEGFMETEYPESIVLPLDFDENGTRAFNGLQVPEGTTLQTSRKHGGGLSALMKYGTELDPLLVKKLYDRNLVQDPPATAIRTVFSEHGANWWRDFVRTFARREIYDGPFGLEGPYDNDMEDIFTIDDETDTLHVFTSVYPDISARFYRIDLQSSEIDTIKLSINSTQTTPDNLYLLVFGYKDTQTDPFLFEHFEELTISDVKSLMDAGYTDLCVAVTNASYDPPAYDGSTEIELRVETTFGEAESRRCMPWFSVYRYYTVIQAGDPPDTIQGEGTFMPNWEAVAGYYDDNTFTAVWDTTDGMDNPYSGTMHVTFNDAADSVTSFTVEASIDRNFYPAGTERITFEGTNLPLTASVGSTREFNVTGTDACTHITKLTDTLYAVNGDIIRLDSVACVATSYVELYFYTVEE